MKRLIKCYGMAILPTYNKKPIYEHTRHISAFFSHVIQQKEEYRHHSAADLCNFFLYFR